MTSSTARPIPRHDTDNDSRYEERRPRRSLLATALLAAVVASALPAGGATLPQHFEEVAVFTGLSSPTSVRFAPDGRVFVIEKAGRLKVFDSLADSSPDLVADFTTATHDFWDRGALGLAVHPHFPDEPYVYVLYTLNRDAGDPGAPFPRWPDSCPDPPGATTDGCVVDGRLSRFRVLPDNTLDGTEQVLLEDRWCQQYPSHTVGGLVFGDGPDHPLYVSAGDGANFNVADHGQGGGSAGSPIPANPCGDPPGGRGGTLTVPTAEGGALRAQDLRTPGDAVSFDGAVLRIDADTGAAPVTNPLWGGDPGDDPVVAYGLRNPFRMTRRPGTDEIWTIDVGWGGYEEINRIPDPADSAVENFGWPCYEGSGMLGAYAPLDICANLYADAIEPATAPYFEYAHGTEVDPDPSPFRCSQTGSSSIAGLTFLEGTAYPAEYDGALFFADYSRDCLFVLRAGPDGLPDPAAPDAFADGVANPVDLVTGPDGLLYYVDFDGGRVMRIEYAPGNRRPTAVASASPSSGPLPLAVQFDGSGSSDPDPGATLTYEWDLDGDGSYDDAAAVDPFETYPAQVQFRAGLRVTDEFGARATDDVLITAGNSAPTASISGPAPSYRWRTGDTILLSGAGADAEDGALGPAAMSWEILLYHCPGGTSQCHAHPVQTEAGTSEITITAPDHEWLSYLEVRLTVTDSGFPGGGGGQISTSDVLRLDPREADVEFQSLPAGLSLTAGPSTGIAPFTKTMITGSSATVDAISPQDVAGARYEFVAWSDGGPKTHDIAGPERDLRLEASYEYTGIAGDWWNASWLSRMALDIDNAALTESQFDVPLLVRLDATRIDYATTSDAGEDLRFVTADGTTLLAHEISAWDESGTSLVWVRVPEIPPPPAGARLWLYWDSPGAPDGQDASAVWSNGYRAVWHFDGDTLDATSFANHGADNGTSAETGAVGGARRFDGSDWIDAGNDPSLAVTGQLTLSAWIRIDDPDQAGSPRILDKKAGWDDPAGYDLEYKPLDDNVTVLSSGPDFGRADGVDLDTAWHLVTSVIDGTVARIWVDGVEVTTDSTCDPLATDSTALTIGRGTGGFEHWRGGLDELRVAASARTPEWIALQHRSMTDTLLAYGTGESSCGPYDASCDGVDDDCDGSIDEDPVATPPHVSVSAAAVSWSAVPTASAYDVVAGDLGTLAATGGDFDAAVDDCLADDTAGTAAPLPAVPAPGGGLFVLVRAVSCAGPASWDTGKPGQAGSRDAGLAAASKGCP